MKHIMKRNQPEPIFKEIKNLCFFKWNNKPRALIKKKEKEKQTRDLNNVYQK